MSDVIQTTPAAHGPTMGRRAFVRLAAACLGAGSAGLSLLLSACGGSAAPASSPPSGAAATGAGSRAASGAPAGSAPASGGSSPAASAAPAGSAGASASGTVKLPSYIPAQGPKPDLPPVKAGDFETEPGYLSYPKNLFKSVASTPGKGGQVSVMTWLLGPPPPTLDQNPAWQEINKQLGATMSLTLVPFANYTEKFTTTIAGGNLPDLLLVPLRIGGTAGVPGMPQLLNDQFTDLTPYLGGDAIKAYPNLASFPSRSWKTTIYSNRIYGVPIPISPVGYDVWINKTRQDALSLSTPKNADDYKKLLQAFTNPSKNQWGTVSFANAAYGAAGSGAGGQYTGMFGVPNNWGLSNGKLVKDFETDQAKATTQFVRDLYAAHVYYPDTSSLNILSAGDLLVNGTAGVFSAGWPGYQMFWDEAAANKSPIEIRSLLPFGNNGGKGTYLLGSGNFGFIALKKASSDRVQELLGIINFLAAPFGSQEALLTQYGVKDTDYTLDAKGNPVLTAKGKQDTGIPWNFIGGRPPVLYDPNAPDFAKVAQPEEAAMLGVGVDDPTLGLYSATDVQKGQVIGTTFNNGLADIVTGRRPMSDYDGLVKDWQNNGGNQIRSEFEQALASAA